MSKYRWVIRPVLSIAFQTGSFKMSISLVSTSNRIPAMETNPPTLRLFVVLSRRLVADAISSFFSNAQIDVRIYLGDLQRKSKREIEQLLEPVGGQVVILDSKSLRELESTIDCTQILPATILLTCPDELTLNGFSRKDVGALVSWDNSFASLRNAVGDVQAGGTYVDQLLTETLEEIARNGSTVLTNRQMQILRMVASGDSSREIAAKLKLSRRTVENHRARILERLGVASASEMVQLAHQNGWI